MYRSELHSIIITALEKAKWTRSTRDEDNFRQVVCAHLYEKISPNNTEIPSTRSGCGDIVIFGRKIEIKYVNSEKRDKLDTILADFDCLLDSKVDFCIVAVRFTTEHRDAHLVRAVDLPLLASKGVVAPVASHNPHKYYGPGIFLPACYPHDIKRLSINEDRQQKSTNSYLSVEYAQNIERSSFIKVNNNVIHVDVIGSKEDGLLTFLYKRADDVLISNLIQAQDITVPYKPAPLKLATIERVSISTQPKLNGRKTSILEENVALITL